jgi:hypothetical protein
MSERPIRLYLNSEEADFLAALLHSDQVCMEEDDKKALVLRIYHRICRQLKPPEEGTHE